MNEDTLLLLSPDEWLGAASVVAAPLPGLDVKALRELKEDVRQAYIDAGVRGLSARELLTFETDGPTFHGAMLELLTALDASKSGITVTSVRAGGTEWISWMIGDAVGVEQRFLADGTLAFGHFPRTGIAPRLSALLAGNEGAQPASEIISMSREAFDALINGEADGLDKRLASALRVAGGVSVAETFTVDSGGTVSGHELRWVNGDDHGTWVITYPSESVVEAREVPLEVAREALSSAFE